MNYSTRLFLGSAVGILFFSSLTSISNAIYMEQSQSVNANAQGSANCTGDCNTSVSSSVSVSTSQRMVLDGDVQPTYSRRTHGRVLGRTYIQPVYIVENADGQVRLDWGYRGGTCHVRYTEANQTYYKYATAASCDDGGVTISGLIPGDKYRFQVRQDNGAWSRAVTVKAG